MTPKWMEIALGEIGTKELAKGENPRIIEYHSTCTLGAKKDEIAWCSAFVNWCLTCAGIEGTNSALAKSWLGWGHDIAVPEYGCITVIKHMIGADEFTGSGTGYHVGFYHSPGNGVVTLLGGNQGDSVKLSSFPLTRYKIVGYRIPEIETSDKLQERMDAINSPVNATPVQTEYVTENKEEPK